jgi:glycosyltransferase involved in cell wall biosynthesis
MGGPRSRTRAQADGDATPEVAVVALELSVGGLERVVINLLQGLMEQGEHPRLVLLENDDNSMIPGVPEGVDVVLARRWLPLRLRDLRRATRGAVADLFFWGGNVRPLYRLAVHGRPVVLNYQAPYPRRAAGNLLDRITTPRRAVVVACSEPVKDWYLQTVHARCADLPVIHNVAMLPSEAKAQPLMSERNYETEILMVARVVPQKDPSTAVRGLAKLRALGVDAHLTYVGDGDGTAITDLLLLASELEVSDHITWRGETWDPGIILGLIRRADIAMLTSRYEGFSVALLEAALAGLAIVASDIAPNRALLGDSARYFPVGDSDALAGQLAALARDPALRRQLGDGARRRVEELYSVERFLSERMAAYAAAQKASGR